MPDTLGAQDTEIQQVPRTPRSNAGDRPWRIAADSLPKVRTCGHDDDPVIITGAHIARCDVDAADADADVTFARTHSGTLAGVGAKRLDPDLNVHERRGIAHCAVDDRSGPTAGARQLGDDIADQCGVDGGAAVDHQDSAVSGFAQHRLQQRIVLETTHCADQARELCLSAELPELGITAAHVGADIVNQIGGRPEGDPHLCPGPQPRRSRRMTIVTRLAAASPIATGMRARPE